MLRDRRRPRTAQRAGSTAPRNAEASPLRYEVDPQDQFRIMGEIEDAGEELVGIYHSHTRRARRIRRRPTSTSPRAGPTRCI